MRRDSVFCEAKESIQRKEDVVEGIVTVILFYRSKEKGNQLFGIEDNSEGLQIE